MSTIRRSPLIPAILLMIAAVVAGCRWTTRSGLPEHIRTLEIPVFGNTTLEPGIEALLTRELKRMAMADPRIRLVNHGGDAVLSGHVVKITRYPERIERDDRPASMSIVIQAEYSLFDAVEQKTLIAKRRATSSQSSSSAGLYEAGRAEASTVAEGAAVEALAREMIRGTIGMW